jgi:hypothetical protein
MRQKVSVVILALLASLLAGCSGDVRIENPGPKEDKEQSQSEEMPSGNSSSSESVAKIASGGIGDTLTGDLTKITFNSASFAKASQFLEPEYGNYVVLNLTIENMSDESVSISSFGSFELQGTDLYIYSLAFGVETRGSLDTTLAPGSSFRGEIAFDVPDVEGFELRFKEGLFNEASAQFNFSFSEISG